MRILVVDDHAALRQSLGQVLKREPDVEVVGEASDGCSAVQLALELEPDVVIMDVAMPRGSGIDATRRILERRPRIQVVGLSVHSLGIYVSKMLQAGARAYVLKDGGADELLDAVHAVRNGQIYLSPGISV